MSMSRETAIKIVEWELSKQEGTVPLHQQMRMLNDVLDANNSKSWDTSYPEQDIRFAEFCEQFIKTQQQKDISCVQNNFNRAYSILFMTIQIENKEPTIPEKEVIRRVYAALERLGRKDLLIDGLNKSIVKKYLLK